MPRVSSVVEESITPSNGIRAYDGLYPITPRLESFLAPLNHPEAAVLIAAEILEGSKTMPTGRCRKCTTPHCPAIVLLMCHRGDDRGGRPASPRTAPGPQPSRRFSEHYFAGAAFHGPGATSSGGNLVFSSP